MYIYTKRIFTLSQGCSKKHDLNQRHRKRWYDIKDMLSQEYVKDMMSLDGDMMSY